MNGEDAGIPRRPGYLRAAGAIVLLAGLTVIVVLIRAPSQKNAGSRGGPDRHCGQPTGIISEGEHLPVSCEFETLAGSRLESLGAFQSGRPMVLNFWASWCPYCINEMPDFQRVHASLGDKVKILGLDLLSLQGETRSAAQSLARQTRVEYPLGYDEGGALYAQLVPRLLMPTTIFVRADGIVAFRQFGPLDEAKLRSLISKYLGVR